MSEWGIDAYGGLLGDLGSIHAPGAVFSGGVAPPPVGASFFPGMEQSPYNDTWGGAWTLDAGIAIVGKRVAVVAASDPMSSYTNWVSGGTRGSIEFDRQKCTSGTGVTETENWQQSLTTGDFDAQIDYDFTSIPADAASQSSMYLLARSTGSSTNYCGIRYGYHGAYCEFLTFLNSVQQAAASQTFNIASGAPFDDTTVLPRAGTLRMARTGTNLQASFWNQAQGQWQNWDTLAMPWTGDAHIEWAMYGSTGGNTKGYWSNARNVRPASLVTGNATSPVYDTLSGLRRIQFPAAMPGTGGATATVQYRFGSTSAACLAASWTNLTASASFTPSDSNRFVQIRVQFNVPAGASSPQVGPFLILGANIDQTFFQQMFVRLAASLQRHTDVNNRLAVGEAAVAGTGTQQNHTAMWPYAANGVAAWLNAGNGPTLTWQGTTFDLAAALVAGIDQCLTNDSSNATSAGGCLNLSAVGLTGVEQAYSRLTISSTQKTNWGSNANSSLPAATGQANFEVMAMAIEAALDDMHTLDSSFWTAYADSAIDVHYANAQAHYQQNGLWDDGTAGAIHFDIYTASWNELMAIFMLVRSGYHNNATMLAEMKASGLMFYELADSVGQYMFWGRSICAGTKLHEAMTALWHVMIGGSGLAAVAAELLARAVADLFADGYLYASDGVAGTFGADPAGYALPTNSVETAQMAWFLGQAGYSTALSSVFQSAGVACPLDGAGAAIWPEAALVAARGNAAGDPLIYLPGGSYDLSGNNPPQSAEYNVRVASHLFPHNIGYDSNAIPTMQGGSVRVVDSTLHTNQYQYTLAQHSTAKAFRLGKAAGLYRTGNPALFGGGVNAGTQQNTLTFTESWLAYGRHVVNVSRFDMGTDNLQEVWIETPPVPLSTGKAVANAETNTVTTTWAYEEGPASDRSHFIRALELFDTPITGFSPSQGSPPPTWRNRVNLSGASVQVKATGKTLTGTQYAAADMALCNGTMVPATEAASLSSLTTGTDTPSYKLYTGAAGNFGEINAWQYRGTGSGGTNPTVGLWSLTGTAVLAFAGLSASSAWFGAHGATAISYNGTALLSTQTAGNISVDTTIDANTTRVYCQTGVGNITLQAACLPTGFSKVYSVDTFGTRTDITASCTVTAGVSVVIPAGQIASAGESTFDIQ